MFLLEQSTLARSADQPNVRDCLSQLEESSNFSAGVLQANLANKMISIAGRARPQKTDAMHVTAMLSFSNGKQYIPHLLNVSPGIGLKRCSQCFNNFPGIFI